MRLAYRLLNVFANEGDPFSGNPLCVFEDGSGLSDEQLQGLARQFNLSETTFLVPPADGAAAGVRIFTTSFEMPFAGHPTLGTAHVARALGLGGDSLSLSMPAGVIPVEADGSAWTLTANPGSVQAELADTAPGEIEARALITDGTLVSEDPATGSACANLGAWFVAEGRPGEWLVGQGAHVGRPSTLRLSVGRDETTRVGGLVREVGSGEVVL
jgi:predicted PhzF superfamily epimerase YddE/YHI9